jgi:hypothetical protein
MDLADQHPCSPAGVKAFESIPLEGLGERRDLSVQWLVP